VDKKEGGREGGKDERRVVGFSVREEYD